jgi:hypothetical protein
MIILRFVAVGLKPQLHVSQNVKCPTFTQIPKAVWVYTGREIKIPYMMRDQPCASAALPKTDPVLHPLDGRLGGL